MYVIQQSNKFKQLRVQGLVTVSITKRVAAEYTCSFEVVHTVHYIHISYFIPNL
jgi:cytochrome c-type biogenesis protein CcmE